MNAYSFQYFFRKQFGFHVRQPEVFPEAVAGDRLNTAVFAVGFRVMDRAVDEVIGVSS